MMRTLFAVIFLASSMAGAAGLAAEPKPAAEAFEPVIEPPRECNSCSARHKARQRMKQLLVKEPKAVPLPKPKDAATTE